MTSRGSDQHETRCHCGRLLRAAKSVARGFGPRCWAKIGASARTTDLSAFTPEQAAKAIEAIEQAAIVPLSRRGVYAAVSGAGDAIYVTDATHQTCTCRAGQNGRRCYHLAAALILDAAAPARKAA